MKPSTPQQREEGEEEMAQTDHKGSRYHYPNKLPSNYEALLRELLRRSDELLDKKGVRTLVGKSCGLKRLGDRDDVFRFLVNIKVISGDVSSLRINAVEIRKLLGLPVESEPEPLAPASVGQEEVASTAVQDPPSFVSTDTEGQKEEPPAEPSPSLSPPVVAPLPAFMRPTCVAFLTEEEGRLFDCVAALYSEKTKRVGVSSDFDGVLEVFVERRLLAAVEKNESTGVHTCELLVEPALIKEVRIFGRLLVETAKDGTPIGVPSVGDIVFDHIKDGVSHYRLLDGTVLACLVGFETFVLKSKGPTKVLPEPPQFFARHKVALVPEEARFVLRMARGKRRVAVQLRRVRTKVVGAESDSDVLNELLARKSLVDLGLFVQAESGTLWRVNPLVATDCRFVIYIRSGHHSRVERLKKKQKVAGSDHWLAELEALAAMAQPEPAPISPAVLVVEEKLPPEAGGVGLMPVEEVLELAPVTPAPKNEGVTDEATAPVVSPEVEPMTVQVVQILFWYFVTPSEAKKLLEAFMYPDREIQGFKNAIAGDPLGRLLRDHQSGLFRNIGGQTRNARFIPVMERVEQTMFGPRSGTRSRFCTVSESAPAGQWRRDLEGIANTGEEVVEPEVEPLILSVPAVPLETRSEEPEAELPIPPAPFAPPTAEIEESEIETPVPPAPEEEMPTPVPATDIFVRLPAGSMTVVHVPHGFVDTEDPTLLTDEDLEVKAVAARKLSEAFQVLAEEYEAVLKARREAALRAAEEEVEVAERALAEKRARLEELRRQSGRT